MKLWMGAIEQATHSSLIGVMAVNTYGFQHEIFGRVATTDICPDAINLLKIQLYQIVDSYFVQ
jgi:hypothetical protein